jgi:hypothetical protein
MRNWRSRGTSLKMMKHPSSLLLMRLITANLIGLTSDSGNVAPLRLLLNDDLFKQDAVAWNGGIKAAQLVVVAIRSHHRKS